jgi:hypothetical protein
MLPTSQAELGQRPVAKLELENELMGEVVANRRKEPVWQIWALMKGGVR